MKSYWFNELPVKLQKKLEKKMVDLVTNKEAKLAGIDTEQEDEGKSYVWVQLGGNEDESIGVTRRTRRDIQYCCANYVTKIKENLGNLREVKPISNSEFLNRERGAVRESVEIIMEKLPERVALLLAVIHRPVYEIYKERVLLRGDKNEA